MSADLAPRPVAPGTAPQQVVDQITGAAKSSFSLGMKLLARPRRQAMRAVYAFCRIVDDIADGDLHPSQKLGLLDEWREEVDRLFEGRPISAIGHALLEPVADYHLPKAEFLMMIDGMEMDANGPIIAPSKEELFAYNRRVAGSVGLLSMRIFGAWRGKASQDFAIALANALQLTNILRDVEEDAEIMRLYLPAEVLENAGISPDPATISMAPALPQARAEVGQWAEFSFEQARTLVPVHERVPLAPALAMYGVYRGYYDRMKAMEWRFTGPVQMGKFAKLRLGLSAVVFGVR
ncbi:MAG: squalene/phytoene synthase family protein [Pseudomonadota bacterium]